MTANLKGRARALAKRGLVASGLLRRWHGRFNRDCLTVAAFHRVLAADDPRYPGSNPTYTATPEELDQCLRLFARYYNGVSLGDIVAARAGGKRLPDRALIISFDDGWQDTVQYALPVLRRHGFPAVLFVATGATGREQGFWQEEVLDCVITGRHPELAGLKAGEMLVETLLGMPAKEREIVISKLPPPPHMPRRMANAEELRAWRAAGMAIGGHGHSHDPLTGVDDPKAELAACRDALQAMGFFPESAAFSFPHGRMNPGLVKMAREAGFDLLFTSVQELVSYDRLPGAETLGRVEVDLRPFRQPGKGLDESELIFYLATQKRS